MQENKHVITMLVDNEPGVLARVVGLFGGRGFNIESLCVAETVTPGISRITIVTKANPPVVEQIEKQLNKLIDVVKLIDMTADVHIERELMLIKVSAVDGERDEVKRLVDIFHGQIIDVTDTTYTIEITGNGEKLNAFVEALSSITILEVVRSGMIGIGRGEKAFG